jgi:flagellar hook-associated protein 1
MSLAASLSSALSGLTANARAAEIVSSNVANAMTEGYGRRSLELSSRMVGAVSNGVQVTGVNRWANPILLTDRRIADAGAADSGVRQAFLADLERLLGSGDAEGSLTRRVGALDTALIEAASRPDSPARLNTVLVAVRDLAGALSGAADQVQTARTAADRQIAGEVSTINTTLAQIADMNQRITAHTGTGEDDSALIDQRQQLIDRLAGIIPLREMPRERGQVALYTTGGASLLEGRPMLVGFTASGLVTADMTLVGGGLSGLTLNGQPIPVGGERGLFAGGSLAAHFAVRDELGAQAQTRLDAMARNLAERFSDPAVDPTIGPGGAGLFTDLGAAFDPVNEAGFAQRLRVHASVDPAQGGALWRLRDGVGAVAPGAAANSALLSALQTALTDRRPAASGDFMPGARGFAGFAADLLSGVAGQRLAAAAETSFATSRAEALRQMQLEEGVDTDQEMQTLLEIERGYAANARVIQTVDEMINALLNL